jgi:hypothetical protein
MGDVFKTIQTIPRGLLHLLGLKNLGRVPSALLDEVRPTIDIQDWWLREKLQRGSSFVAFNGAPVLGGFSQMNVLSNLPALSTVPNGETWFVKKATAEVIINGVGTADLFNNVCIATRQQIAITIFRQQWSPQISGAAHATLPQRFLTTGENFWLEPGMELGIQLGSASAPSGTGIQIDLNISYARFLI